MEDLLSKDLINEFRNYVYENKIKLTKKHYIICIKYSAYECLNWIHKKLGFNNLFEIIVEHSKDEDHCIKWLKWYSNKKFYKHETQFITICYLDYYNAFKYMINSKWNYRSIILSYILKYKSIKILNAFLKINAIDVHSMNNSYYVCWSGDFNYYKYFLSKSNSLVKTDLDYTYAAYNGHLKFFVDLENQPLKGILYNIPNWTVPFFAAAGGHLELLKFSIEKNYHKNRLYFRRYNPNISDVFYLIFGKGGNYEIFINYLYNEKISTINKILDISELTGNFDCLNYLAPFI